MELNWDAMGAIGEIGGAIAVVVTLVFLIYQLRQNTSALRQQSERASADAIHAWSRSMMDPNVAGAVSKGYVGVEAELTPEEMVPIEHFMISFLVALQQDFFDWKRGFQSDELWASRAGLVTGVFISFAARKWWEEIGRDYVVPEFREVIATIIADGDLKDGDYWKRLYPDN
jgi:hypothetical protein